MKNEFMFKYLQYFNFGYDFIKLIFLNKNVSVTIIINGQSLEPCQN